jgi:hypothetical protein
MSFESTEVAFGFEADDEPVDVADLSFRWRDIELAMEAVRGEDRSYRRVGGSQLFRGDPVRHYIPEHYVYRGSWPGLRHWMDPVRKTFDVQVTELDLSRSAVLEVADASEAERQVAESTRHIAERVVSSAVVASGSSIAAQSAGGRDTLDEVIRVFAEEREMNEEQRAIRKTDAGRHRPAIAGPPTPIVSDPESAGAWDVLRSGVLFLLAAVLASVFASFGSVAIGLAVLFGAVATYCVFDYAAFRLHEASFLPPRISLMAIYGFAGLSVVMIMSAF